MRTPVLLLVAAVSMALTSLAAQAADSPAAWVQRAVTELCPRAQLTGLDAQIGLPGSWLLDETRLPPDGPPQRISLRLALPHGDEIVIERRQFGGQLRQFRVSHFDQTGDGLRPRLMAIADGSCAIGSGRAIRDEPPWRYLDQLDGDLETMRWTETLQAPWPAGRDPGGVRVGLIDSGLAYDLPLFRDRLARDDSGMPLGYDYWDLDPWPYDGDVARGPFLPLRHGTAVASILAREAPDAALVPFRYPRPDMDRLADLVDRAASDGVRILAIPLGSRTREDWTAFAEALTRHDILAIVSAGNDGRDIDTDPVCPAALGLDQMVVVTSSDGSGRLAPGSNWGARSVDVMLPAENLSVTDFRGASGSASGTSYAVPRLAALAARLLAEDPDQSTSALKAALLARATPSPYEARGVTSAGWIPDPMAD